MVNAPMATTRLFVAIRKSDVMLSTPSKHILRLGKSLDSKNQMMPRGQCTTDSVSTGQGAGSDKTEKRLLTVNTEKFSFPEKWFLGMGGGSLHSYSYLASWPGGQGRRFETA
jgi:hypothetical protein